MTAERDGRCRAYATSSICYGSAYAGPRPAACRTRASRSDAQRAECSPETVAGLRDQWADSVSRAVVEDRGGVLQRGWEGGAALEGGGRSDGDRGGLSRAAVVVVTSKDGLCSGAADGGAWMPRKMQTLVSSLQFQT